MLTNEQCVFSREFEGEKVFVAINATDQNYFARFDAGCASAIDLITGKEVVLEGGFEMPPYSAFFLK